MKRVLAMVFVMSLAACASMKDVVHSEARVVSNGAVLVIETAQDMAEVLYEMALRHAMENAAAEPSATKESVMAVVNLVRKDWEPIKELFGEARAIHEALVFLIENGSDRAVIAEQVALLAAKQATIAKHLRQMREAITEGLE